MKQSSVRKKWAPISPSEASPFAMTTTSSELSSFGVKTYHASEQVPQICGDVFREQMCERQSFILSVLVAVYSAPIQAPHQRLHNIGDAGVRNVKGAEECLPGSQW